MEKDDLKKQLFSQYERDFLLNLKENLQINLRLNLKYISQNSSSMVVAGGFFASYICEAENSYNDIDIFIQHDSHPSINLMRKDSGFVEVTKLSDYVVSDNHIVAVFNHPITKFQYIFTKYKTRQEVIKNFDFVHCMISYEDNKLYLTRQMFDAASKKLLIPNKPVDQIRSKRWNKFRERGYHEAVSI